jgi:queuosine precursor transporter
MMAGERSYRWLTFLTALFVTTLIVSNIIAVKLIALGPLYVPSAVILFPIAYIFGDVLTEVYGYRRARSVIWTGFFCNLLAVVAIWIAGRLTAAPFWSAGSFSTPEAAQSAYDAILGFTPRLLVASFVAYLVGEFLNSFVLAKLKVRTAGRWLWLRTITSTLVGEGSDSLIFMSIAFYGILPPEALRAAILAQWFVKVAFEVIATPFTYLTVGALKRAEAVDIFDRDIDFNPFATS